MKKEKLRVLQFQAVIISFTLLLIIVVGEVFCRIFLPPMRYGFPRDMYIQDDNPYIGFRMAPNFEGYVSSTAFQYHIETNDLGFRSNLPFDQKKPNIGLFGDSFAFGQGVEEPATYASVLYTALNGDYNILNTGTCSYKPMQEYQIYKELKATGHHFDKVILQLYTNDIKIQEDSIKEKVIDGRIYQEKPPTSLKGKLLSFLAKNSELFLNIYNVKRLLFQKESNNLNFIKTDFGTRFSDRISSTKELIQQWKEDVENDSSTFLVFYVPDRIQVEPAWKERFAGNEYNFDAAQEWLNEWTEQDTTFQYLDIVPAFRKTIYEENKKLYFDLNGHCNENGHQLIASIIANYILSIGR